MKFVDGYCVQIYRPQLRLEVNNKLFINEYNELKMR